MILTLDRQLPQNGAVLGVLFVDGEKQCETLEGVATLIPAGHYRLTVTWSNRFQRQMPLVCGVPGFEGIRIHAGNTTADTAGCILIGTVADGRTIINSRSAFDVLFPLIQAGAATDDGCWIDVRDAG